MTTRFKIAAGLLASILVTALPAHAGRSCDVAHPLKAPAVATALQLAERTQQALDASGAQVVLLARAGQDLSKYGVRYSHLGFAWRQPDATRPGGHVWRVLRKLNQCGTREAAWVAPTPDVQARLLPLLLGVAPVRLSLP